MKRPAPFARMFARVAGLAILFSAAVLAPAAPGEPPADVSAPTLVTLHYENADPKTVFDDLFHQLGVDYTYSGAGAAGQSSTTIDADKQPFWAVMNKLCDSAQVGFFFVNGSRAVVGPTYGGAPAGIRLVSGRCMIVARTIAHRALLTDPDHLDECVIEATLLPEPNLRIASYTGRVHPDLAVDEKGTSLVPPPDPPPTGALANGFPTQNIEPAIKTVNANTQATFQIALHVPPNAGQHLADVKGVNHLKVVTKTAKIEFSSDEFSTEHSQDFHGATLTVSAVRNMRQPPEAEYAVSVSVKRNDLGEDDWNQIAAMADAAEISILDDKGRPLGQGGRGSSRGAQSHSISGQFRSEILNRGGPQPGEPATCRVLIPDEVTDLAIPFEFKNLPLP